MKMQISIELLSELAQESEISDPIDWGMLNIDEQDAYRLIAMHVSEMEDDIVVLKASLTKLMVENFVLNMKLLVGTD
tara:strand:- start:1741 stop:1971 length:231 start_codon:yes stop_codon:yes gene_type:complete